MIEYNIIDVGKDNFKLSPSGLNKFVFNPEEWLNDMHGMSSFKGNIATIYGTCIHYIFESLFDGRTEDCYWKDVKEYLIKEVEDEIITEEESFEILNRLETNRDKIITWYINDDESTVISSEAVVKMKLPDNFSKYLNEDKTAKNGYYIAGSLDAVVAFNDGLATHTYYDGNGEEITKNKYLSLKAKALPCSMTPKEGITYGIRDYKTANRKSKSVSKYMTQLVTYAVAYNSMLKDKTKSVSFVEVVLITETKKDGLCLTTLRETISQFHEARLMALMETIVSTHSLAERYPKLEKYLFRAGIPYSTDVNIF